jgi:hypothetical protein
MSEQRAALAYRGTVEARGVLLPAGEVEPALLVPRLLPLLRGREQLAWVGEALLVRFAAPRWLRTEYAPGYVVCEEQGCLTTFPLRAGAEFRAGSLLWLRGGEIHVTHRGDWVDCDPSRWLSLGELEVLEVTSLGAPPSSPALPPPAPSTDVRRVLGVAPLSAEASEARAALTTRSSSRLADTARRAVQWLDALRRSWAARRSAGADEAGVGLAPRSGPSLLDRAANLGLKLLSGLGLLALWVYPQQRYLRRLTDLFQSDVLEALRQALPLGGEPGNEPARLTVSPPGRRADLALRGRSQSAATFVPLAGDWEAHLRALYLRALRELERTGQIEQAAFVLAELLRDTPGALALLERHGKLRLAAELAEAREQPPGERVRLWFLVGEIQRAIDVAIRHDAFGDAIQRLDKRDRGAADRLRLVWADRRAAWGNYFGAAHLAWDVKEARGLVRRWLELACDDEGSTTHLAWVRRLVLDPELAPRAHAALAPVLAAEDAEAAVDRSFLISELARHDDSEAVGTLIAPVLRAVLRDTVTTKAYTPAPDLLKNLLKRAPALRADWPDVDPSAQRHTDPTSFDTLRLTLHERGTLDVRDVASLHGGRTLVALGTLGAMLLSRRGTRIVHWERLPVDALVPSTGGGRVITLAPSGELARVARLDLATRKLERWFELPIARHATQFDGIGWDVTVGGLSPAYLRLDAAAEGARALFHVNPGPILLLKHGVRGMAGEIGTDLLVSGDNGLEQWSYDLPGPTLRARREFVPGGPGPLALANPGTMLWLDLRNPALPVLQGSHLGAAWDSFELGGLLELVDANPRLACSDLRFAWVIHQRPTCVRVDVFHLRARSHTAQLDFEGASRVSVRVDDHLLVACDDVGRVLRVNLATREHAAFCL